MPYAYNFKIKKYLHCVYDVTKFAKYFFYQT